MPPNAVEQRRLELRRDELTEQVVLVVDGRERRRGSSPPSRARGGRRGGAGAGTARRGPTSARVVVGVGVGVEAALEVGHHQHPAGEDEHRRAAAAARAGARARRARRRIDAGDVGEPLRIAERAARRAWRSPSVVSGCMRPQRATAGRGRRAGRRRAWPNSCSIVSVQWSSGDVVAQHPHVAAAVDVDAERVLALARTRQQVAARDDRVDVEADAVVGADGERHRGRRREPRVEIHASSAAGAVLEERVVVVPGPELVDRARRTGRAARRRARPSTRRTAPAVASSTAARVAKRSVLVELAGREAQREVVAVAEVRAAAALRRRASSRTRSATAAPTVFDASHAARAAPASSLAAQDLGDRVVVDRFAVELRRGRR